MAFRMSQRFTALALLGTLLGGTAAHAAPDAKKAPRATAHVDSADAAAAALKKVMAYAHKNAVVKPSYEKMLEDALAGVLGGLDAHSAYMDKKNTLETFEDKDGGYAGIGTMIIGEKDGTIRVDSVVKDTPAMKAGIVAGDAITHIDGSLVTGMALADVAALLRDEPDTPIKVTIRREGVADPLEFSLTRAFIEENEVGSALLGGDIAHIYLSSFNGTSSKDVYDAFEALKKEAKGHLNGVILDLRDNPGGFVDQALGIASMFLGPGKPILTAQGRDGPTNYKSDKKGKDITGGLPMVVLINNNSASASEIVAAALQENNRAVVIGDISFGKGSVQSVLTLDELIPGRKDGMKVTSELYYTPSGRSLQGVGIIPDIAYTDPAEEKRAKLRESDLENTIPNPGGPQAAKNAAARTWQSCTPANNYALPQGIDPIMLNDEGTPDYALQCAINYLRSETKYTIFAGMPPRIPGLPAPAPLP